MQLRKRMARPRLSNRRGAITVLVGIMMVTLLFFAAIAIDASRIFATKNQMQAMADAAAMAGAIQMLRDSSTAGDTALVYATRNGLSLADGDQFQSSRGVWNTTAGELVTGDPADALRVDIVHRVPFVLAQVFGNAFIDLRSSAIAWSSAPVVESRGCVKPLALPYSYVRDKLPGAPSSELSQDDIRELRSKSPVELQGEFEMARRRDTSLDNKYFAVDLPPEKRANGATPEASQGSYQQYIGKCKTTAVRPGDEVRVERGNRRESTVQGLHDLCQESISSGGLGGRFDLAVGICYVGGSAVGMPIRVTFWDNTPAFDGTNISSLTVKMVGAFVVTNISTAKDSTDEDPLDSKATLKGYLTTLRDYGVVGNTVTTLRRPVLVR